MEKYITCSQCGGKVRVYANPTPTADVVIYDPVRGVVLIERGNSPYGFALPGGFVDEGESVEDAAVREMFEETGLRVILTGLLGVYSRPDRDPRFHTMSVVFVGYAENPHEICAGDDALKVDFYPLDALPPLVFDHSKIMEDFREYMLQKRYLAQIQPAENA